MLVTFGYMFFNDVEFNPIVKVFNSLDKEAESFKASLLKYEKAISLSDAPNHSKLSLYREVVFLKSKLLKSKTELFLKNKKYCIDLKKPDQISELTAKFKNQLKSFKISRVAKPTEIESFFKESAKIGFQQCGTQLNSFAFVYKMIAASAIIGST